ncbi:ATP synthase gamma-related protein [Babesia gibsoni]|uniref:ATP synthase gamma-related protein n=1 Tax=Babesia gibsoni TaxID=33632 RepID=A0AAD8PGP0_BABGI|nr:ATP synthase gamma-related protein [Babesia gibsoni]
MADNPNQEGLDDVDAELEGAASLPDAHPVNGIPASCRRIKLYEIYSTNDTWVDKGTGYCHVREPTGEGGPQIVMELEQDGNSMVVVSNIMLNTNYSSQNDSIIIWQEGEEDRLYRALSFQNVIGHRSFWSYITSTVDESCIQSDQADRESCVSSDTDVDTDMDTMSGSGSVAADAGSPLHENKYSTGYRALPIPTVLEIRKLESSIDSMLSQTAVADMVFMDLLDKRWFADLFTLMRHCIEVEDLSTLSSISAIMARLILNWCGNLEMMHVFVSDEVFFDLLQAFEYDAELISQNLCLEHVKFFRESVKHHDVISLDNPSFYRLVHSSYRIEYLKDVVLPRLLDEFSIQRLNSVIYSNMNEILNIISTDGRGFVDLLKEQLSRNYMSALLLRELLGAARCAQVVNQPDRISLLLLIKHTQLLNELSGYFDGSAQACRDFEANLLPKNIHMEREYSNLKDTLVRSNDHRPDLLSSRGQGVMDPAALAVEIFNLCLEVFPSIVRTAVFLDAETKNEPALLLSLCDVIANNPNEAVQTQTREIFLRLLDPKNMDLPEKDEMCSLFYDNGVLDRLLDQVFGDNNAHPLTKRTSKVYTMDILSLCAREHRHRFKLRVQSHKLPLRVVTSAMKPFDKFVAVGAMKFLHVCIKMKDMSVERHIIKYKLLRPVLWILKSRVRAGKDGGSMLESVCLGILSTIDSWALDGLVDWLFQDPFCVPIIAELKKAYARTSENFVIYNLERMYNYSRVGDVVSKKRHAITDPDRWFEEDDDDDLGRMKRRQLSQSNSLVDGYDDEDDDDDDDDDEYDIGIEKSNIQIPGSPLKSQSLSGSSVTGWPQEDSDGLKVAGNGAFEFNFKPNKPKKISVLLDSSRRQPTSGGRLATDFILDSSD